MRLLKILPLPLCLLGGMALAQKETDIVVRDKTVDQRCVSEEPRPGWWRWGCPAGSITPLTGCGVPLWRSSSGVPRLQWGNQWPWGQWLQAARGSPFPWTGPGSVPVPFRLRNADALPYSIRFHGYRRNPQTGEPTFLFEVDGLRVEHRPSVGALNLVGHLWGYCGSLSRRSPRSVLVR